MLTLITATLNAAPFIDRALQSAANQGGPIQHLIIDGGSTDGTIEACRGRENVETTVAPGCSIYEAWNIGLEKARGDAIMFLNADDELSHSAHGTVEAVFALNPSALIVAGRASFHDPESRRTRPLVLIAAPTGTLDVPQLVSGVPAINAMAFRRKLFECYGRFETTYRVAGDRAFLLRLALSPRSPSIARTDKILYRYHVHTGSLTLRRGFEQRVRIARDHIALCRALLASDLPAAAIPWLRHWRQREAAVATLRCLRSGQPEMALSFARALVS